ncbi:MAG TPA: hypothetical protein DDX39_01090 [Bacteroidales bacterium]|nr:MAG: hypothetical protein A2W98_06675 [Bacteroidetes bacterium GWF2_33_38]OFY75034.1 MAG: hypothetical protein A2265_12090 [Bacteroidetes bacterium RIFOXYA12_FULL_33_9]OFY90910.1 MAG: hypothetical protein A2236_11690 [Bacteroidetes bacterium RIFOXYA2_FULL_33_7]HBF87206.1 hypothetical protein [Bacteroidales bacterium]
MKYINFVIAFLLSFAVNAQKNTDFFDTYQELKYENGKIKEQADWKNGLIVGSRKFYNPEGKLIEEHVFSKDSIVMDELGKPNKANGMLITYSPSGAVASKIQVVQQLRESRNGNEYTLRIESDRQHAGYHENTENIAYKFSLEKAFYLTGSRMDYYKKNNVFFYDVFLLHDDNNIVGLRTNIQFFYPDGKIQAKGEIHNGKKVNEWVFYYPDGKVESEGSFLSKGIEIAYKVGTWKYYTDKSILIKEENYFNGTPDKNFKYGSFEGISKYYFPDGKLQYVIRYPIAKEVELYTDTIEAYYANGNVKYKYTDENKVSMSNGMPYNYSGKWESYYENGEHKELGYLGKKPRFKVDEQETSVNPCILTDEKKIGVWYFFNEKGNVVKITEYTLCGEVKTEYSEKEVSSVNNKYNLQGKGYEFDFSIKF